MHRIIIASLLLCGAAGGAHEREPSKDWKVLREKTLTLGLLPARVDRAVNLCRKGGFTVSEADALLCPVYSANAEALPTECVFIKIEEGLAKRVDAAQVAAAAEARLDCLRRAQRLIGTQNSGRGGPPHLLVRSCMVLESGLPEEVLQAVFERHGGRRYGRLIQVLEAAETLQLAGFDPQNTQQIMNDCLDRQLTRLEVQRAVDYILAEQRNGRDFEAIRAELWVDLE